MSSDNCEKLEWCDVESVICRNKANPLNYFLNEEVVESYSSKATQNGFTFPDLIQCDMKYQEHESNIGLVIGDEDCYDIFADIIKKAILHKFEIDDLKGPFQKSESNEVDLEIKEVERKYVKKFCIGYTRNLRQMSLTPVCSRSERRKVEKILATALYNSQEEGKGKYYPLWFINRSEKKSFVKMFFNVAKPSLKFVEKSQALNDWPDARGVYINESKTLLAKINYFEHLNICTSSSDGKFEECYMSIKNNLQKIEKYLEENDMSFMFNENFGYLQSFPGVSGNGFYIKACLKLPNLMNNMRELLDLFAANNIMKITPETDIRQRLLEKGLVPVCNKPHFGVSEEYLMNEFVNGVKSIYEIEEEMEQNEDC